MKKVTQELVDRLVSQDQEVIRVFQGYLDVKAFLDHLVLQTKQKVFLASLDSQVFLAPLAFLDPKVHLELWASLAYQARGVMMVYLGLKGSQALQDKPVAKVRKVIHMKYLDPLDQRV